MGTELAPSSSISPAALALQPALNQALMYYGDIAHEYKKLGITVDQAWVQLELLKDAYRRALAEPAPQAPSGVGGNVPPAAGGPSFNEDSTPNG